VTTDRITGSQIRSARLRQAACHPALIDPTLTAEPSAKLDMLLPQIAEVVEEVHRLVDRGVTETEDDEEGGGLYTMTDDAFDLTGDEDTAATETPDDDAGDDESVDEGSLLGDDKLAGAKGHGSDDQHGAIGEEA